MDDLKQSFDRMQKQVFEITEITHRQHKSGHDFGTGDLLYPAEIHTIQAIGDHDDINVTALSEKMNVTKATISERIKKLKRLELISAQNSETNLKEVILRLTERGRVAYDGHEAHHQAMYQHFMSCFGKNAARQLRKCQQAFTAYLDVLKTGCVPRTNSGFEAPRPRRS